ncbi:insulinase family protein [candidate division KSB1 bacterium]|nr:insulinase family protein [candidate division KSB1 bacterium]
MLKKFLITFSAVLFCSRLISASDQTEKIHQTTLKNGLNVIVIENATVPLVTIEIDVRNGAFTEPPEYDGLSHFFEHMFFKANGSIPNQQRFLERTRELGMTFNATTSEERVNYSFTILKDSLEAGLEFMKAAITTPLFLEEELERERLVVIDEYDRNESNPIFHLNQEVNKKLWYKYYSRKNPIGSREVILAADPDKMRVIQKKYYIPNNSALLVAGDVKHERVFKSAQEYFSDWQKRPDPFLEDEIPFHPQLEKSETVIVEQPVNAVTIKLGWQGPSVSINTKATYVADVYTYIMNRNSKFPRILVSSGLFTSVLFSYQTLDQKGPITILATTTAEKFWQAKRALFEELKYLLDRDYFTDEQIEYAKSNLEARQKYAWERPSTYVQSVGFWWSVTGGLEYYLNYIENIKKVTREDISGFVKKYIQEGYYVMGVLVSPEDKEKIGLNLRNLYAEQ